VGGLPSDERPGQGGADPEGPAHEGPGYVDPDFLVPFDVLGRGVPWWDEAPTPPDVLLEHWWNVEADHGAPPTGRRRPLGVRAIGLVTAAALALATIGAGIGEVLGLGSPSAVAVRAEVTSVGPAPASGGNRPSSGSSAGTEVVRMTLFPPPGRPAGTDCLIEVVRHGLVLGSEVVSVHWARGTAGTHGSVRVPIDQPAFAGSPRSARVACSA
jgi:hypothetical protein